MFIQKNAPGLQKFDRIALHICRSTGASKRPRPSLKTNRELTLAEEEGETVSLEVSALISCPNSCK